MLLKFELTQAFFFFKSLKWFLKNHIFLADTYFYVIKFSPTIRNLNYIILPVWIFENILFLIVTFLTISLCTRWTAHEQSCVHVVEWHAYSRLVNDRQCRALRTLQHALLNFLTKHSFILLNFFAKHRLRCIDIWTFVLSLRKTPPSIKILHC